MVGNNTNADKGRGINSKPATIVLTDGTVLDARDHIRTDDDYVAVYLTSKETGIDVFVPAHRIDAIVRSHVAAKMWDVPLPHELVDEDSTVSEPDTYTLTQEDIDAVGELPRLLDDEADDLDNDDDEEPHPATIDRRGACPYRQGAPVEYDGKKWTVNYVRPGGKVELWRPYEDLEVVAPSEIEAALPGDAADADIGDTVVIEGVIGTLVEVRDNTVVIDPMHGEAEVVDQGGLTLFNEGEGQW